ncbi:MAG: mechanosensitive ion channel family protein [Phycisphaeraceae bacterium]
MSAMAHEKRDGSGRWLALGALLGALLFAALPVMAQDQTTQAEPATVEVVEEVPQDAEQTTIEVTTTTGEEGDEASVDFEEELRALSDNAWWRWLILLGLIFIGLILGKVAQSVLRRVGEKMDGRGWTARSEFFTDAASPVKLLVLTIALSSGLAQLQMGEAVRDITLKALQLLIYISIFWYAFNLVAIVEVMLGKVAEKSDNSLNKQLIPIIRKTLRVFLIVVATLFIAQNIFGQQIGAWLAGFGIAGLAVSLAAQDSLKNLFGSITILLDRPFQVGDRIKYADFDGIIEDIGFRSTKVRTLAGHVVTVPNSNIVNDPIENVTKRPTIRRIMNITITYDTPLDKIRQAVQILRDILDEEGIREPLHPVVNGDELPPRVYFSEFNAASLNIFLIYWFGPPVWWDYLEHGERLKLRIFEEFEKAGIDFAFPTQTLHLANDPKRQLAIRMLGNTPGGGEA